MVVDAFLRLDAEALDADGTLRLALRGFTGAVALADGDRGVTVRVDGGRVVEVVAGAHGDVVVRGPSDGWVEMLAPVPRPFYQDVFPAIAHHGFAVEGDFMVFCQRYAAVQQLVELLREA